MKRYALIVAGGSGSRMQSTLPKQFIELGGLPILMHTISKFEGIAEAIVLVLPASEMATWQNLVQKHQFKTTLDLVKGGQTRIDSVKYGLNAIQETHTLVAIHDGVRPFIEKESIELAYQVAESKGNAVIAVSLKDSIRQITESGSQALDRSSFRLMQTPQTFHTDFIKKAYQAEDIAHLTDDASVAENFGMQIHLIEGSYRNIKITTQEDLLIGEAFLSANQAKPI